MKASTSQRAIDTKCGDRLTLMYHNVTRPGENFGRIGDSVTRYFVTGAQFAEHLQHLSDAASLLHSSVEHFRVTANSQTPKNSPQHRSAGDSEASVVPMYVELTFDDGWAGSFEVALEALERHDMTATVFITTGLIGQPFFADEPLIRDAVATGRFRIGAHGVTHRLLETLSSDEVDREMRESKDVLEGIIGAEVDTFALPGGSCSTEVRETAKRLGYRELHSSVPSLSPIVANTPAFDVPRFAIQQTTTADDIQNWIDKPLGVTALVKNSTLSLAKSLMGRRRYASVRSRLLGSQNDFDMTDLTTQQERRL